MLTLTPDEILNEVTAEYVMSAAKGADAARGMIKGKTPEADAARLKKSEQAKRLYDASAKNRREGNFRQGASAQGPSRIPTGEA